MSDDLRELKSEDEHQTHTLNAQQKDAALIGCWATQGWSAGTLKSIFIYPSFIPS